MYLGVRLLDDDYDVMIVIIIITATILITNTSVSRATELIKFIGVYMIYIRTPITDDTLPFVI